MMTTVSRHARRPTPSRSSSGWLRLAPPCSELTGAPRLPALGANPPGASSGSSLRSLPAAMALASLYGALPIAQEETEGKNRNGEEEEQLGRLGGNEEWISRPLPKPQGPTTVSHPQIHPTFPNPPSGQSIEHEERRERTWLRKKP